MIQLVTSGNAASGSLSYNSGYATNDLIVLLAYNTGSSTVPSTPSGYTQLTSAQQSADGSAMAVFYKFAASGSETAPTPTNSTSLVYAIYRGVDQTTPFSGTGGQSSSSASTTISYSGIGTFSNANVDWVLTFGTAHGTTGNVGSVPPTNTTLVSEYKTGSDDATIFHTNTAVASYSFNSKTLAAAQVWMTKTTELHAAAGTQTKSGNFTSTSSPTLAMGNTTTGDTILVVVGTTAAASVSSITDSQSNTYTKVDSASVGSNPDDVELWMATGITGGTTPTITVTLSAAVSGMIIAREYNLANMTLDKHTATTGSGASVSSGASATTTQAVEIVVGWALQVGGGISSVGSGYSNYLAQLTGSTNIAIEDKLVTSTGAQTATFTGGGTAFGAGVATFYASAGTPVTKTQAAVARIQATVTKTQSAVSRISVTSTKTQSAVSRIQTTVTKTQSAVGRVSKGVTKTQTATANIVSGTFFKTQSATARIRATVTKTQSATSRIQNTVTATQPAVARIAKGFTKTQTAVARLSNTVTKTQSATSRITNTVIKTQPAVARVSNGVTKTQSAISRISITGSKTQSAVSRISTTVTKTQTATAHITAGQLHKTQTATARIIGNPVIPKSYLYKVYNNGTYLGLLPSVISEFTYAQDINTAGAQLQIVVAETADISAKQSPGPITDESGNPITDESGNNLLVEGATNIVGVGTDSTLIKNGNKLVVYEFSRYYPNGRVAFSGEMERWEAAFGGDSDEDTVTILAYSDGQDLDNYILQGSPYVSDQTQATQNASAIVNTGKGGAISGVGQTFTTASGVTNVAAIDVMLSGTDSAVTVTLWPSVSAANSGTGALGSVTQAVSAASPTVTKFAFSSPIAASASTSYFFTVTESAGGSITVYYKNSNVYSGGDMYRQNYGGGGGDTLFHLTPFSDVSTLSDLYFTTYSSAGATTAAFSGVDPSTGMVKPVIDQYRAQGGQINYAAGSIDATGTTVSYTFNTATVFEGIKEALALAPSGYYFYVDVGSDTLFFKNTSATADFVLTKGKHLSAVKIVATIENVKNELYFSGGLVSGSNLFKLYSNNDSITKYGPRLDRQSDNRVTTSGTANAVGNSFIAANQAEQYQTVLTVLDGTMDITLLKPGKVIGYNGFGTFIDNLLMQIVRIEYHPDYVTLTLGVLPPRLNPGFEKLNRELLALQTVSNPSSPS